MAPELAMVMSYGSNSQVPEFPKAEDALTTAPSVFRKKPEVSIKPPSPPFLPPFAIKVP